MYSLGADAKVTTPAPVVDAAPVVDTEPKQPEQETPLSLGAVSNPFVAGLVSSIAVYTISRALAVDAKKALRIALVWGGTKIVYNLAMDMLRREVVAVTAAAPK